MPGGKNPAAARGAPTPHDRARARTQRLPPGFCAANLAQLEIEAEVIELDQLGALIPEVHFPCCTSSAAECATAAIETVITTRTDLALNDEDRDAIDTIGAEAHPIDAGR